MAAGPLPLSHPQTASPLSRQWRVTAAIVVLYACATLQFVRFYVVSATFYLNLPAYLNGKERLPFQYRVLPALIIRGLYRVGILHAGALHTKGAFTAERAPLYLISLVSLIVAGLCTQATYRAVTRSRALEFAVYPIFVFTMMWTYSVHVEANFSYPYDFLSVAFFAAGLLCIVRRHYLPLLAVLALGTLNRETTLFLIGLYILDAATPLSHQPETSKAASSQPLTPEKLSSRSELTTVSEVERSPSFRQVPWLRAALLLIIWITIKALLAHHSAANDRSEDYIRLRDNLGELKPRLWPALLNICGYMLPVVLLFRRDIHPLRFRNYLWIFPLWFAAMFYAGVIVETRIYGELCPYVAIALTLIMENRLTLSRGSATQPS